MHKSLPCTDGDGGGSSFLLELVCVCVSDIQWQQHPPSIQICTYTFAYVSITQMHIYIDRKHISTNISHSFSRTHPRSRPRLCVLYVSVRLRLCVYVVDLIKSFPAAAIVKPCCACIRIVMLCRSLNRRGGRLCACPILVETVLCDTLPYVCVCLTVSNKEFADSISSTPNDARPFIGLCLYRYVAWHIHSATRSSLALIQVIQLDSVVEYTLVLANAEMFRSWMEYIFSSSPTTEQPAIHRLT